MKATLLSVGISSRPPFYMHCIENDSQFVAEQHKLAYDRFPRHKKFPVHKWEVIEHHAQCITADTLIAWIRDMPVQETMRLYFSGHGFVQKIDGKKYFCMWLGDYDCWITFDDFMKVINEKCRSKKIKRFSIWLDTCFSGRAKKDVKAYSRLHKKRAFENSLSLHTKYIEPFGNFDVSNTLPKTAANKKISIWCSSRGRQTSYGNFAYNDYFMLDTNGLSLATVSMVTAMNLLWDYIPGQWIVIQKKKCRPRSDYAVMKLAQRRINASRRMRGLAEWLDFPPKTPLQNITKKGKTLYY